MYVFIYYFIFNSATNLTNSSCCSSKTQTYKTNLVPHIKAASSIKCYLVNALCNFLPP